jgi:alpha-methylacyl-CoA racemase
LLEKAGVDDERFKRQMDAANWPALKNALAQIFRSKTRDQWCALMEGTDVCFAPVLSMTEAPGHPHNMARQTFVEYDGVVQPAPAPRFSRTEPELSRSPPAPGEHTAEILKDWGIGLS